jgi:thiol-disulfide isomerase/thioredoxin
VSGQPAPARRRRRWWIDIAVIGVAFVGAQAFLTRDVVRGALPPIAGALADGGSTSLPQWRAARGGEPFLLYVWAAWCGVCKAMAGSVDAVAREAPVLTIAMQSGGGAEVRRHLDARGHDWPTLVDGDAALSRALGVGAVPTLIFVGRDGRVRAVTQGYTSEAGIRLRLWWAGR